MTSEHVVEARSADLCCLGDVPLASACSEGGPGELGDALACFGVDGERGLAFLAGSAQLVVDRFQGHVAQCKALDKPALVL